VHLEQRAHPGHRHRARRGERQQPQHLVPGEGQAERPQDGVDPLEQELLHADDGRHHRHPVGRGLPAVGDPLPVRLADGVALAGAHRPPE
jgi:hypothetical protein